MPHVLEFEARPHDTVREAQRVLVPEGTLVVSGFSPWSLMGLWRAAHRSRVQHALVRALSEHQPGPRLARSAGFRRC